MNQRRNPIMEAYAGFIEGFDLDTLEDRLVAGLTEVVGTNANNRLLALMILNVIVTISNDGMKRIIEETNKHLETIREFNKNMDEFNKNTDDGA